MEIFRDPIWNFIGVILAFIALIIPLIIYFLNQKRKELCYEILSLSPLLSDKDKLNQKIKILYDNQEVNDVKFVEIRVVNTGNVPIPTKDYDRPLKFSFNAESKVLSADITNPIPETLRLQSNYSKNEITLEPVLMNSKDSFIIKAMVANSTDDDINVDCRIINIKKIKEFSEKTQPYKMMLIVGIILIIFAILIFPKIEPPPPPLSIQEKISFAMMIVGIILIYWTSFYNQLKSFLSIFK